MPRFTSESEVQRYELRSDDRGLYIFDREGDCAMLLEEVLAKLNQHNAQADETSAQIEILERAGGYGV